MPSDSIISCLWFLQGRSFLFLSTTRYRRGQVIQSLHICQERFLFVVEVRDKRKRERKRRSVTLRRTCTRLSVSVNWARAVDETTRSSSSIMTVLLLTWLADEKQILIRLTSARLRCWLTLSSCEEQQRLFARHFDRYTPRALESLELRSVTVIYSNRSVELMREEFWSIEERERQIIVEHNFAVYLSAVVLCSPGQLDPTIDVSHQHSGRDWCSPIARDCEMRSRRIRVLDTLSPPVLLAIDRARLSQRRSDWSVEHLVRRRICSRQWPEERCAMSCLSLPEPIDAFVERCQTNSRRQRRREWRRHRHGKSPDVSSQEIHRYQQYRESPR